MLKGLKPRTHRGVLHNLREEYGPLLPLDVMMAFRNAQRLREKADYEVMFKPTEESVDVLFKQAESLLDFAANALSNDAE